MFGSVSKTLLTIGFVATALAAKTAKTPSLKPLSKDARDLALTSLPGIRFDRASSYLTTTNNRKSKNRLKTTKNTARISSQHGPKSGSRSAANILGALQRKVGGNGYENITSATAYGTQYAISVNLGGQDFLLILDTGSSDTWTVQSGYSCTDWYGDTLDQGMCGFASSYKGEFTYGEIEDEHFYIMYGDGEIVSGPLGLMDVSIAGIDVTNQTIALANETYWYGDNVTSGIIGLAYPSLTNAYYGPETFHNPYYQTEYSPIFSTMVSQGLIENYFSIAISRNSSGGQISFGGVPEFLEGLDYYVSAETDIIIANVIDDSLTAYDYSFYTIIPDGWIFGTSTDERKLPYIVDSGTTLIYLPPQLAESINLAFDPPAMYSFMFGGYFTTCDAVAPKIGIVIDGVPFYFNPVDLIYRKMKDPITGLCMTAFADGGSGPYILGDVFMQNVLAIFDVDDGLMEFYGRRFY